MAFRCKLFRGRSLHPWIGPSATPVRLACAQDPPPPPLPPKQPSQVYLFEAIVISASSICSALMADVFRVASHTPVELAQLIAGYRHSFRIIACLNKAWHAAVHCLAERNNLLYERFLQSAFSVGMLCDEKGKRILNPKKLKKRLDRLLKNIDTPTQDVRFWYTAQSYLHRFCELRVSCT